MLESEKLPKDPTLEASLLEEAHAGDVIAQCRLSHMYAKGLYVEKDEAKFLQWARLASEQGYREGFWLMGLAYGSGIGVPQTNMEEAAKWFERAAYDAHPQGAQQLGRFYAKGIGVLKSPLTAYKWLMWAKLMAEMTKKLDQEEGSHWTVEEVLETIDEDIRSLEDEMTQAQHVRASEVWEDFLNHIAADVERKKTVEGLP